MKKTNIKRKNASACLLYTNAYPNSDCNAKHVQRSLVSSVFRRTPFLNGKVRQRQLKKSQPLNLCCVREIPFHANGLYCANSLYCLNSFVSRNRDEPFSLKCVSLMVYYTRRASISPPPAPARSANAALQGSPVQQYSARWSQGQGAKSFRRKGSVVPHTAVVGTYWGVHHNLVTMNTCMKTWIIRHSKLLNSPKTFSWRRTTFPQVARRTG